MTTPVPDHSPTTHQSGPRPLFSRRELGFPRGDFGFTRREFIGVGGALALGGLVAACGGGSSGSTTSDSVASGVPLDGVKGDVQVVKRFPNDALVPGKVRLPVSLADTSGVLGSGGTVRLPDTLTASVVNAESGATVIETLTAEMHGSTLSVPYWPFTLTIEEPGIYLLRVAEAPKSDVAFQLMDRKVVPMPQPGDPLPPFDTPTESDPRGVDPICSRAEGVCPFHSVTLTEALASGKPVVYLIGTPAFCTTGTCAPALEAMMEAADKVGDDMVFVHADVYADKNASTVAPAVQAYKLSYEPVLYLTDSSGVITARLDAVFDSAELLSVLGAA